MPALRPPPCRGRAAPVRGGGAGGSGPPRRTPRCPAVDCVKVSLPRSTVQGSPRDSDRYAGRQYAPLMAMELPEPDRPV
ncbi:DUF4387 family protein [Streptomyces scopuliridis]|uniref:DUF4387 family protein n=1 Tax=Streptomyces scopuliridis TaxID=452529 RepID=UPI0007C5AA17|nr:DUF4387 family protein [Streptomyces scopuliridis]